MDASQGRRHSMSSSQVEVIRIEAVYEDGYFKPVEKPELPEGSHVTIVVSTQSDAEPTTSQRRRDPLEGLRVSTGIPDFAERFDDYRFNRDRE
jgi:predicted DNA-binding antitoxin AbrB/MazE fold protein